MEMRGVLVLLAVAVSAVFAETDVTFPEVARERSSRIVSGWEANEGQFPFQLSLRMVSPAGAVSSCGATLIHSQWGLTAAHCTAGRVTMVIRAGVVNMTRPSVIFETSKYRNHPRYNELIPGIVQPNDIGLLEFGRVITFSDVVKPIRLQRSASKDTSYEGVQLTASGWGRTWTNGNAPENLNWVYLRGVSNLACFIQYGTIVEDSTICASGYNVTSQSTCQGDSGGPLTVVDDDGALSQVGVTSFVSGTGCHTDFPGGFIRPGHYHDWFREITGIDFDWVYEAPITTTTTEAPEEDSTTVQSTTVTTETPEEDSTSEESSSETSESSEEDSTSEESSTVTTEAPEESSTSEASSTVTTEAPETEEIDCEDEIDEEATRVHVVNN